MADLPQPRTDPLSALRPRPWLTPTRTALLLTALLVATLLAMFGVRPAYRMWKARSAGKMAAEAIVEMHAGRLDQASKVLSKAFAAAPDDPAVLRAVAQLMQQPGGDPMQAVSFWRKLAASHPLTAADKAAMARSLVQAGETAEARRILGEYPPHERALRPVLELEAALLDAEGEPVRAREMRRRAWLLTPDEPECALQLAAMNLDDPFVETRSSALEKLWGVAKGDSAVCLRAVELLVAHPALTLPQARELLQLLESRHPRAQRQRCLVLSALVRLSPAERRGIVDREAARVEKNLAEDSVEVLRWLVVEQEHARVLSLITPDMTVRMPFLFAIYTEALASAGRWTELRQLLRKGGSVPLPAFELSLMEARCAHGLNESPASIGGHLQAACRRALSSRDAAALQRTTAITESLGYQEIVLDILREAVALPQFRALALERMLSIHDRQRNTEAMLASLQALLKARPHGQELERLLYLKLLVGHEIESTAARIVEGDVPDSVMEFLHALTAYRMSDMNALRERLARVKPSSLSVGQRAVYAGLLHIAGETARAFEVAERIQRPLLLEEEERFLAKAL